MDMASRNLRGSSPPDFLVKLLAMVQSEDPKLIAWNGGKVFIQDPLALEKKMSAYFSSFQRQLNNFGFRKVEGKGKLAPCMYMHDDLQGQPPDSLLRIRRKAPTVPAPPAIASGNNHVATNGSWQSAAEGFQARSESKRRRTDLDVPVVAGPAQATAVAGDSVVQRQQGSSSTSTARIRSFEDVARDVSFVDGGFTPRHPPQQQNARTFSESPAPRVDELVDMPPPLRPTLSSSSSLDPVRRESSNSIHKQNDAYDSGMLLSFLENDPTSHLPPNATAMKFFDPANEVFGDLGDQDYTESQMRVNIFGKQHRLNPAQQRAAANGVAG